MRVSDGSLLFGSLELLHLLPLLHAAAHRAFAVLQALASLFVLRRVVRVVVRAAAVLDFLLEVLLLLLGQGLVNGAGAVEGDRLVLVREGFASSLRLGCIGLFLGGLGLFGFRVGLSRREVGGDLVLMAEQRQQRLERARRQQKEMASFRRSHLHDLLEQLLLLATAPLGRHFLEGVLERAVRVAAGALRAAQHGRALEARSFPGARVTSVGGSSLVGSQGLHSCPGRSQ